MTVGPEGQQPRSDERTVGPEDQTANLERTFERSQPPVVKTAKEKADSDVDKQVDDDVKATDQTAAETLAKPAKDSLTDEPSMSILQTERTLAREPETKLARPDSGRVLDSQTADDSFDRSYPIGRYQVRRLLGQGAFGRVYEAHDPQLDRRVAVKVSKDLKGPNEVDRFLREARSAAHLRHPAIIPVFEYGQIDDLSMIVYELVDGETLRSYIKRKSPMDLSETITIIRKIAEGLDYAHKEGIIHRDMKPDNVLIDRKGEPHIADFGCARRSDDQDMHQTIEGSILGTPMYMSPEQASGRAHRADGRTDVWSLGVMLYEMVSGEKPFVGKLSDLLHLIRHHDPKPLRKVNPSTPRDIETICARCLRRELDQRFATAGELADELERFQRGEPILSRRISLATRTWLWAKRNRAVASLLTAVAVTLLVGTTVSTYFAVKAYYAQKERARVSLEQLTTAESSSLDNILVDLLESKNSMRQNIGEQLAVQNLDEHQRRRLRLGTLYLDKNEANKRENLFDDETIRDDLLSADGRELLAFCSAFSESEKADLSQQLWQITLDTGQTSDHRLRAACALAQIDPQSSNWEEKKIAGDVAGYLTAMNLVEVQQWLKTVEPIRAKIQPKLREKFEETRTLDDASPETAAVILSNMLTDYVADVDGDGELSDAETSEYENELKYVVNLVPESDPRQLAHLLNALDTKANSDKAKKLLIQRLQQLEQTQETTIQLVSEKANIILALIRMEHPAALQQLRRANDNSVATEVIERLAPASTSLDLLLAKIETLEASGENPDALAAVLLSLGQFTDGQLPQTRREVIFEKYLLNIFKQHNDARVHSCTRWLMCHWGFGEQVRSLEQLELQRELPEPGKNWHVDLSGNTFVVFEPDEFVMGEGGDLPPHLRRIPRRFGICIHETTTGQFISFERELQMRKQKQLDLLVNSDDARAKKVLEVEINRIQKRIESMSELDSVQPITDVDFFKSLAFCRWLSEEQNLDPSLPQIDRLEEFYRQGDGMSYQFIDLEKNGYRLPTAGEWEYACRAGTNTTRSLGISDDQVRQYAWYVSNSQNTTQPVAGLKPNEVGLFDILGNVSEWCLDWYHRELPPELGTTAWIDFSDNRQSPYREHRGGSYKNELPDINTAKRYGISANNGHRYLGFRMARTYPTKKEATPSVEQ